MQEAIERLSDAAQESGDWPLAAMCELAIVGASADELAYAEEQGFEWAPAYSQLLAEGRDQEWARQQLADVVRRDAAQRGAAVDAVIECDLFGRLDRQGLMALAMAALDQASVPASVQAEVADLLARRG